MFRNKRVLILLILLVFIIGIFLLVRNFRIGPRYLYPKLVFKGQNISYGFGNENVFLSPTYTGVISNIQNNGDMLILEMRDPKLDQKIWPEKYKFVFSKFIGIAEQQTSNENSITWTSYPISPSLNKLLLNKYASIKFNSSSNIHTSSDLNKDNSSFIKLVTIYSYAK